MTPYQLLTARRAATTSALPGGSHVALSRLQEKLSITFTVEFLEFYITVHLFLLTDNKFSKFFV